MEVNPSTNRVVWIRSGGTRRRNAAETPFLTVLATSEGVTISKSTQLEAPMFPSIFVSEGTLVWKQTQVLTVWFGSKAGAQVGETLPRHCRIL